MLRMKGVNLSETDLKKFGVFGTLAPDAWRKSDARLLESWGLLELHQRSCGYSVTKKAIPDIHIDNSGCLRFQALLKDKLRMSIEESEETLEPPERRRAPREPMRVAL